MKKTVTFEIPEGWIGCNFAEMVIINERDISQSKKIYGVAKEESIEELLSECEIAESEIFSKN